MALGGMEETSPTAVPWPSLDNTTVARCLGYTHRYHTKTRGPSRLGCFVGPSHRVALIPGHKQQVYQATVPTCAGMTWKDLRLHKKCCPAAGSYAPASPLNSALPRIGEAALDNGPVHFTAKYSASFVTR
jgi:hypothetical protein